MFFMPLAVGSYRLRASGCFGSFGCMARPATLRRSRIIGETFFCSLVLAGQIAFGADLTVRVTDAESAAPIAGAVLTATRTGPDKAISQEVKSDADGICRLGIEGNEAGLQLDVKKSGWCPLRLEVSAQSFQSAAPLSFAMKRAGTFGGTIRDETGKPVVGAHVSANFPQKLTGPHISLDDL